MGVLKDWLKVQMYVRPFCSKQSNRMPVLLGADEYDWWLRGSVQDVIAFQYRRLLDDALTVV
jgi:hypothetical protein